VITILAVIFWFASPQGPLATQTIQPPRSQARATVAGVTLRADVSDTLSFVTLKLTPLDEPATTVRVGRGGPVLSNIHQATSDAAGQFLFPSVIPGRYSISAEREGYVPAEQFQTGPRRPVESILTITAGMKLDGLAVAMVPVPTISGTVFGPLGQRLAGATVQAYRVQYTPYGRRLERVASTISYEGGEYRLFRLKPGYYYVSASYSDLSRRAWKSVLQFSPNLMEADEGFSTAYYPGELKVADAKVINLFNGGVSNADIVFRETRYFSLSVKVRLPPVQERVPPLTNIKLAVLPVGADLGSAQDFVVQGSGTAFQVDRLPEGEYVLVVLADLKDDQGNTYSGVVSDTRAVRLSDNTAVETPAMYPISVPVLMLGPIGTSLQDGMQIQLSRVDANVNQTVVENVNPGGQFYMRGIGPGTYDVFIQGMPRNTYLQDVRLGRREDPRESLRIRVDSTSPARTWHCEGDNCTPQLISEIPILVQMSAGGSSLGGLVNDSKGGNVTGAKIVLVPTDPILRQRKDRYGLSYSDTSGTFLVHGLQPGSYTAFAFEEIEQDIHFDPEFNERLARQGTPVDIAAGSSRTMDRSLSLITKDDVVRLTR
jgi:hypothetical protein